MATTMESSTSDMHATSSNGSITEGEKVVGWGGLGVLAVIVVAVYARAVYICFSSLGETETKTKRLHKNETLEAKRDIY